MREERERAEGAFCICLPSPEGGEGRALPQGRGWARTVPSGNRSRAGSEWHRAKSRGQQQPPRRRARKPPWTAPAASVPAPVRARTEGNLKDQPPPPPPPPSAGAPAASDELADRGPPRAAATLSPCAGGWLRKPGCAGAPAGAKGASSPPPPASASRADPNGWHWQGCDMAARRRGSPGG